MSREIHPTRRSGWLYTVLSILVMTAQLVVALAPLAESRDRRMDSHVESGGAQTHRAHNDAACAACQARSIHGSVPRVAVPVLADAPPTIAIVGAADHAVAGETHSPSNPRAPPSVI
jgi:hypothetical protein